jgi:hypothetical protein
LKRLLFLFLRQLPLFADLPGEIDFFTSSELEVIPLVFCGKTVLEDIGHLRQLFREGLVQGPAFVPPQFADLHGLAAWMCYDTVLDGIRGEALQQGYVKLFH